MKRQIVRIFGVLAMLLVAACADAQTLKINANVPFDFNVGKITMPAGDYSIDALSDSSKALAIRNREAGAQMLVLATEARSLNSSPDTCLVFHRYGERYFLSQMWVRGENAGREFPKTKRESETAASLQRDADVVIMAELR